MIKRVFIGGYGASGTRVVSIILQKAGYNVGKDTNIAYDYMPLLEPIDDCWYRGICSLKVEEKEPYALKHGQLMLVIPQLKKDNPDSKFILVIRHPIDNILIGWQFEWENTYLRDIIKDKFLNSTEDKEISPPWKSLNKLKRKMLAWRESHKIALEHTDYIIRLEDLCLNPIVTIKNLFSYLGINKNPQEFTSLIDIKEAMINERRKLDTKSRRILYDIGNKIMDKWGYSL